MVPKSLPEFDLVLFGGAGDLAMRKLLPALFRRYCAGQFPPRARIVSIGRTNIGRDAYLAQVGGSTQRYRSADYDATHWAGSAACSINRIDHHLGKAVQNLLALRDIVQSHLLQLLCIIAMEPPISNDPDAVRDEKLKVLRALWVLEGREVASQDVPLSIFEPAGSDHTPNRLVISLQPRDSITLTLLAKTPGENSSTPAAERDAAGWPDRCLGPCG
jgi:glucose-6-phosphate 1-dehydrogenase